MKALTFSGFSRLEFLSRCRSRLPVYVMVLSAYASFFMYQQVSNTLFVGDGVFFRGDDVAVPD